jgi:hypothetical protein
MIRTGSPANEKPGILHLDNDDCVQVTSTRPTDILITFNVPCILEQLIELAKITSSH